MGLPHTLKGFDLWIDGESYIGKIAEGTEPKLTRKMEEWRGGGMPMPVSQEMGWEAMEMEFTLGGPSSGALTALASSRVDGAGLRLVGAYQDDHGGGLIRREIVVRGTLAEIDFGSMKMGERSEHKYKMAVSYYRLEVNGTERVLIDPLSMIVRINGFDQYAVIRAALGL